MDNKKQNTTQNPPSERGVGWFEYNHFYDFLSEFNKSCYEIAKILNNVDYSCYGSYMEDYFYPMDLCIEECFPSFPIFFSLLLQEYGNTHTTSEVENMLFYAYDYIQKQENFRKEVGEKTKKRGKKQ